MSENNFWVLLRVSLKLKMYRVENRVAKGMPDVHYLKDGKSGWIELKYIPDWSPKRVSVGLRKNQVFWLKEYDENKGRCWILVRIGRDFIGLIDGKNAEKLFKRPSKNEFINLLSWNKRGNMKSEDWQDLANNIAS
jgi:hypothetical protein